MRNIIILFLIFSGVCKLAAQPYDTQAFRSGLKGHPKQVTTTVLFAFPPYADAPNQTESYIAVSNYNPQDICTGQQMFSIGHDLIGTAQYKFDDRGQVYEIDYLDENYNLVTRLWYTYNNLGKWQSCRTYRGGFQQTEIITYRYNDKGLADEISEFGILDILRRTENIYYNRNGKDSITLFSDRKHQITSRNIYSYVSDSLLSEYNSYDADGVRTKRYTASYNPDGTITGSKTQWFNPKMYKEESFKYDSHGNAILKREQTTEPKPSTSVSVIAYKYDSAGNWTKKTITTDGQVVLTSEREIIYYTPEELQ